jgi:hypothetical protein
MGIWLNTEGMMDPYMLLQLIEETRDVEADR